jgi:phosphate transport system protein
MNNMHDHIVKSYDDEQNRLLKETLRMGEMAAAQLEAALDVVQRPRRQAAERIIANDEAIDALEHEVSHDVMKLALRGPMARDLREILAAIRIAADIERIGDLAANVAKRSRALNLAPPLPHIAGLHALGMLAVQQVRDALAAYRDSDIEQAQRVRARDAEIDIAYTGLFRELLTYMMEDARSITAARTCCSWPRTWSASATTPPTSPRTSGSWSGARNRCRRARSATNRSRRAPDRRHGPDHSWRGRVPAAAGLNVG